MLGLNTGHKGKTPSAGKEFWVARAMEDWSWGVFESSPEKFTSQMARWQRALGSRGAVAAYGLQLIPLP